MRTPRLTLALVLAVSAPLLLAACGGDSGSSGGTPTQADLTIVAPGGLKFDQTAYTAPAGKVDVLFQNKDNQSHSVIFEDASGKKLGKRLLIAGGRNATNTVDLPAGAYKVICDVPGHEAGGMHATLATS